MAPVGWPVGYHASLRQEVSDITVLHALTHPTYIHIPHSNAHMTGTVQKSVTKNVSCCIFIKKDFLHNDFVVFAVKISTHIVEGCKGALYSV